MSDSNTLLKEFFREYEARTNRALTDKPEIDAAETAGAFANCIVEASPVGISCGENDDKFLAMIPQGYEHYRAIGTKSMNITAMEFTPIDDLHTMAKISWDSRYDKDGEEIQIEFDVTYFVQIKDSTPKIFAYVTGDEQKALKENGVI